MAEDSGDPQGQSPTVTNTDPSKTGEGQSVNTDQLPEKFKGKTAAEIAKSYLDLEKKLGEQSTTVNQSKREVEEKNKTLQQWEALGKVIQSNPALYNLIAQEIQNKQQPLNQQSQPNDKLEREVTDTKLATQNQIFERFESKFGINDLSTDEQNSIKSRIGRELMEMRGAKDVSQALSGIPLDSLPSFLDKAYKLAIADDEKERARVKGMIEARRNSQAAFGNIPSSTIQSNSQTLTPEQKKVASRLGVSEEKYLKNLQDYS